MSKVFLSFIHEDRNVADALENLVEHELSIHKEVFMVTDQDHLRAGDNWLRTIEDALKSSEIVLSLLSKRSISKPWVNFEAGAGWLAGKRMIPVCIGNQQKGALPNPYSHWQGVNLPSTHQRAAESIVAAVSGIIAVRLASAVTSRNRTNWRGCGPSLRR